MLVIGKSKNPSYFKNAKSLQCTYKARTQNSGWIVTYLRNGSTSLSKSLTQKFEKQPFFSTTLQRIRRFPAWPIFNLSSCHQIPFQFSNRWTRASLGASKLIIKDGWFYYCAVYRIKVNHIQKFSFYKQWKYSLLPRRLWHKKRLWNVSRRPVLLLRLSLMPLPIQTIHLKTFKTA